MIINGVRFAYGNSIKKKSKAFAYDKAGFLRPKSLRDKSLNGYGSGHMNYGMKNAEGKIVCKDMTAQEILQARDLSIPMTAKTILDNKTGRKTVMFVK